MRPRPGAGGVKALFSGYFAKPPRQEALNEFRTLFGDHLVYMFPGRALFGRKPDYVIFHELVNTTKEYMYTEETILQVLQTFSKVFMNTHVIAFPEATKLISTMFAHFPDVFPFDRN
jgi:hypothetical protein